MEKLHKKFAGNWMSTFSFQQNTTVYKNDSILRKEVWKEAIQYPDKFRMDFGDKQNGNGMLFLSDSAYRFSKGKLVRSTKQENDLIFLLGGIYFFTKDSALAKLAGLGYDVSKSYRTTWQGRTVIVIGATDVNDKMNQLWFDAKRKVLVRMFKYENNSKEEVQFAGHTKLNGKGWTETLVKIFINDALIQQEDYFNMRANPKLNADVFNTGRFNEAVY